MASVLATAEELQDAVPVPQPAPDTGAGDTGVVAAVEEPVWQKYLEPGSGREWFWNRTTEAFFFADSPGEWHEYCDDQGRRWWWHSATHEWFYEPTSL